VIAAIDAVLRRLRRIDGSRKQFAGGQYRAPMETISTKGFEAVRPQQPDRRLHFHARVLQPLDGDQWRAIVTQSPTSGTVGPNSPIRRGARGMLNAHRNRGLEWSASGVRVNAVAREHRVSGFDTYTPENAKEAAMILRPECPAGSASHRSRNLGGISSAVAGRGLCDGIMHPGRRRYAECAPPHGNRAHNRKRSLRRLHRSKLPEALRRRDASCTGHANIELSAACDLEENHCQGKPCSYTVYDSALR